MEIEIFRVDKSLPLPEYQTDGSVCFDLYSRKNLAVLPGETVTVPSNFIIRTPKNLAFLLLPRSSLFSRTGFIFPHSVGVIDSDFCGKGDEILIQLHNLGKVPSQIKKSERLAQALFVRTEKVKFREIFEIKNKTRGGFGSTKK